MTPCRSHPKSRAQGLRTSRARFRMRPARRHRSEEHTSELQSLTNLVCRLLLEKKKKRKDPGQARSDQVAECAARVVLPRGFDLSYMQDNRSWPTRWYGPHGRCDTRASDERHAD